MSCFCCCFFFNVTATTEIYTLSLHDALPILAWEFGDIEVFNVVRRDGDDFVGRPGGLSEQSREQ